ncbi:BCCT family transporter [Haloarcula onubensis]|uniref:BCCT family transporter n=1 Tax=Haloarcula onubensis TaxID=2950539 RepID=A0ABU2FIZ5_9EURY|nr:BCCT family transporter [Halomicroarcula sp. S3CR25-11]MDS0280724.1 BCCT family transporter [Halomicroarcula sp. S3CR25-11]
MPTSKGSGIEALVAKLLVPVAAASGAIVFVGFFFRDFVGEAVTGQGWVAVSLVFFGSGLGYLAVLPYRDGEEGGGSAGYLLRVRRASVTTTLREFARNQDPLTMGAPVTVFAGFVMLQAAFPAATSDAVTAVSGTILRVGGPFFLVAMLVAVGFCVVLLVGPWGDIKLGGPESEPTYTYPTYFTLVFTAGIAAGLVFWGPAEALFHYRTPPPYFGAEPRSAAAAADALVYSLFHWGVSAWSAYAAIGVPIAYFVHRRGAPLRVSTLLTPFLGVEGLESVWGRLVDTLAVFATIGGIATSVALVSEQFLAGVGFKWDVAVGAAGPAVFVGGLTCIFVLSSATGIHRGIRRIAGLNVVLFGLFALLLVALGPRSYVADQGATALGRYVVHFLPLSLYTGGEWVASWTVWNWSWWFSWAPFAGLFVAALSRGRRVRTVVFTTVVATAAATAVWFLLLGGTTLFVQQQGTADVLGAIAARGGSEAVAGFPLLAALPLSQLLVFLFLALIVVFMTTSADTSTLVVAILATKRGLAPTTGSVVFWGGFQGTVAVAVLLVGGAETLQALAVLTGGPFAVIFLVGIAGLTRSWLREERGHTSLLARVGERLPTVQAHHDIDPPEEE